MKVRTITYGLSLNDTDFQEDGRLQEKLSVAASRLEQIRTKVTDNGYEVQTSRICFNRLEDWLILSTFTEQLTYLSSIIDKYPIFNIVSLGCCDTVSYINMCTDFLLVSPKFNCSVNLPMSPEDGIYTLPDHQKCLAAANVCVKLSKWDITGGANFRYVLVMV